MDFKVLFKKNHKRITERWVELVIKTYPAKRSQSFFLNEGDPFSNPVGHTIKTSLPAVFQELIEGNDKEQLEKLLDPVIRIRAVQEFSPKEALTFIFYLKDLVREHLKEGDKGFDLLYLFDKRVDDLSLIAFDIYMGCREQIWSFKSRHVVERSINLLEKADMLKEVEDLGMDIMPQSLYRRLKKEADSKKDVITQ